MKVKSHSSGTLIGFLACMGLAFGLAFGVIKSAHLGLFPAALSFLAVCAFQYFIFKAGKGSAYASAQAWAQSNVDIALEVSNIARAEANSLSNAYASAIASANATAQNQVVLQLSDGRQFSALPLLESKDEVKSLQEVTFLGSMSDYSDILQKVQLQLDHDDLVTDSSNFNDLEETGAKVLE